MNDIRTLCTVVTWLHVIILKSLYISKLGCHVIVNGRVVMLYSPPTSGSSYLFRKRNNFCWKMRFSYQCFGGGAHVPKVSSNMQQRLMFRFVSMKLNAVWQMILSSIRFSLWSRWQLWTEFCDALKYDKAKKAFCGSEKKYIYIFISEIRRNNEQSKLENETSDYTFDLFRFFFLLRNCPQLAHFFGSKT